MYKHFESRDGLWVNVEKGEDGETVLTIGEKGGGMFERKVTQQEMYWLANVLRDSYGVFPND